MRIGLLGAGRIGLVHAATLAADPRVADLVIADLDPGSAGRAAALLGARTAESVAGLLASAPDAVVVATPTDTHADLITECCDRGIPLFCEKPCFTDAETAQRVVDHVAASGVAVHVGFQRRFDPGYRGAHDAVRSGALGQVRRLHLVTADPAPPPAAYVAVSGGIHRDCQIHDFDALRWVSGREVVEVFATGANRGADYFGAAGDVDESAALLTLDDGSIVTMQASRYNGAGYDVRMEVAGSKSTISVGLDTRVPLRSVEPDSPVLAETAWSGFLERFTVAYRAEISAFLTMVATGARSPCTVEDAMRALLVADAVAASRRERRPVLVDEVSRGARPVEMGLV
ncbi:Gfo/Idh/MocA family protein [Actinokineospora iranica]|uniref:Myo-inositol 2-dehydrogenase / D-chiro-inositol 1-dehydrogenase n=1 Tax=Actinokineospora iranica TaxID=1271860 RepID=A0A1G6UBJ9_9PSEU|nr:Gfo/Idh/MocA family oxidoreductase [Actinokineospora iranica]SDD38076.1 myo-inositol 2-dehydrogenase / D-chiro-inositol 1-dehydrogenase [Actinokineospora iranica]